MVKWIGCILIFVSTTGIGITKSNELASHVKELEELKKIFCLFRSEIQYMPIPFAELFEKVGQKTTGIHKEWLLRLSDCLKGKQSGCFFDVWCYVLESVWKNGKLRKEELEELRNVGRNLEYKESIDLYINQMDVHIEQMRKSCQSKRKLYQSIGVVGGVFLVILLL